MAPRYWTTVPSASRAQTFWRFGGCTGRAKPNHTKITTFGGNLGQDDSIVATLHERFAARILFLARRELRSESIAEEVCHETLLRVIQALRNHKVNDEAALPGFVAGTARNVILEFRRKESRTAPLGERDVAGTHEKSIVDHSVRRAMQQVFARLKPRERQVLQLYYLEELPKEEIAARIGIDPERVRLVKSRALKSFREFYERLTRNRQEAPLQFPRQDHLGEDR